jgi:hypothetical protein
MEMDVTVQRKETLLQIDKTDGMTQHMVSTCAYEYIHSKMERSIKFRMVSNCRTSDKIEAI